MPGQCFADDADSSSVDCIVIAADVLPGDGKFQPTGRPKFRGNFLAGLSDVTVTGTRNVSACPAIQIFGQDTMALFKKRPSHRALVEHPQSPWKDGFSLATNAW